MPFPQPATIAWDANPPGDQVLDYRVTVNGAALGTTTATSIPYEIPAPGTYVAAVVARNAFGEGPPGEATLLVGLPGHVQSVRFLVP